MSIKSINESFDRLIEKENIVNETQSPLEKNMLTIIDLMEHSGQTNLKAYEYALQDAIEKEFPGKSWWEVTSVNIFWDLFNNRDPRLTVQNIIKDIEGNSFDMEDLDESCKKKSTKSKSIKESKSVIDFVDEIEANKNNPEKCDAIYREAKKTLGKYDMNYVTDVYSKHRKVESKSLKESPIYDMTPQYDARKSFYGKARVDDDNGELTLYSYNVPVARISNGQVTLLDKWDWSQTTLRHVKEFLKQNGFEATTVSQMRNTYR